MTVSLGEAVIEVGADTTGLQRDVTTGTQRAFSGTDATAASAGKRGSKRFGGTFVTGVKKFAGPMAAAFGAITVGAVVKSSVAMAGEFQQSMALIQASTHAPQAEMQKMSDLALKLGRDTVFSANEAADAMLELSKGGLSNATIRAGALESALTLAAAGGVGLEEAATTMGNALNTFSLRGKQAGQVSAALAGAANASSASIGSLSQALSQVGPGAFESGLSIQETTAALGLFANAGIQGSDAGTSLKTMLTRLVPTTDKTKGAMRDLGLKFTDAKGEFLSLSQISEQLQQKMGKLSAAERTKAMATIFGSDATRAATVLMRNGAEGIEKMTKATSDQTAADKMAEAQMSGMKGALEALSGSWETVQLQLGMLLAPAVTAGAKFLAEMLNQVGPAAQRIASALSGAGDSSGEFTKTLAAMRAFAEPMLAVLKELAAEAAAKLGPAIKSVGDVIVKDVLPAFRAFLPAIQPVAAFLLKLFGSALIGTIRGFVNVIKGAFQIIAGIFNVFAGLLTGDWSRLWAGLKQIFSGFVSVIVGAIQVLWNGSILSIFRKGALMLTKGIWVKLWTALKNLAVKGFQALTRLAINGVRLYLNIWKMLFKVALTIIKTGWNLARAAFTGALNAIRGVISGAFNAYVNLVKTGITRMIGFIKSLPAAIMGLGSRMLAAGKSFIQKLFDGIRSAANSAIGFVSSIVEAIKNAINSALNLPLSIDFDKGPIHIHAELIPAFAKGVQNFAGGMALVGERGPELAVLPRGTDVIPADQTRRMLNPLTRPAAVSTPAPAASTAGVTPQVNIVQHYYGPTTGGERVRELNWALRYGTGTRKLAGVN